MGFDGQTGGTTGEWRVRGICNLLFTPRSRRVSGLEALSQVRGRCFIFLRRGIEEIGQVGLRWKGGGGKKIAKSGDVMIVRRSVNVN